MGYWNRSMGPGLFVTRREVCADCNTTGRDAQGHECYTCKGYGYTSRAEPLISALREIFATDAGRDLFARVVADVGLTADEGAPGDDGARRRVTKNMRGTLNLMRSGWVLREIEPGKWRLVSADGLSQFAKMPSHIDALTGQGLIAKNGDDTYHLTAYGRTVLAEQAG